MRKSGFAPFLKILSHFHAAEILENVWTIMFGHCPKKGYSSVYSIAFSGRARSHLERICSDGNQCIHLPRKVDKDQRKAVCVCDINLWSSDDMVVQVDYSMQQHMLWTESLKYLHIFHLHP